MQLKRMNNAALSLAVLLAACGSDSSPTSSDNSGNAPRTIKADPSFVNDVFEILQRRQCTSSGCHGGGTGGLTMTSASVAFSNLVNQPAVGKTGEIRVIPGDAEGSYMVKKLEGAAGIVGEQMPRGMTPLDDIDMSNIKNWINQGAKDN